MRFPRSDDPGAGSSRPARAATGEPHRLEPLIAREVEVINQLQRRVATLRRDLAAVRPGTEANLPPVQLRPERPVATGDDAADGAAMAAAFDRLQEQADALWFEQQWLTAEISVARKEFDRHGPTTTMS